MGNSVYKIVQEKFIEKIEEAIKTGQKLPWQKPWAGHYPVNYVTRRPYKGINAWFLQDGSEFLTWTQICDLKKKNPEVKLKKGCKKHLVVFWKLNEYEKVNEDSKEIEAVKVPLLRYYYVYSIADVEGVESKFPTFEHTQTFEEADKVIYNYVAASGLTYEEVKGSASAYYSPSKDYVCVPEKSQFEELEKFYSVAFHELAHSTGHPSRLKRFKQGEGSGMFGSESYSKEELIAEMSASMLMGMLQINTEKTEANSLAYLHGWLKKIKEDVTLIVSASASAQKVVDYITGQAEEQEQEEVA